MTIPEPQYLRTFDGTYIAYQVVGDGPVDIAWLPDFVGNLDHARDSPFAAAWYESLASFGRLILLDRRGVGLSSRNVDPPNLETRAADLRAVLEHVGSRQPVIGGWFEGLAPGVLLAATDPELVRGLIWWNPTPRTTWAADYPWGWGQAEIEQELAALEHWGGVGYGQAWADQFAAENMRPSDDEIRAMARQSRNTCTPDVAVALARMWWETDLRAVLPSVRVPTLLLADVAGTRDMAKAEYVAGLIPGAEVVPVPGEEWPTPQTMQSYLRPILAAMRKFVGLEPIREGVDSVLAAVLFTDLVESTRLQASMGDLAWKDLIEGHHALVREVLQRWRGAENDTAGDGFYATFDGPARAIRCALEIGDRVRDLGLEVRAGVHVGECELIDGKIGGLAVSIGARICAVAEPSQVLVSQTVKDLVAGSALTFQDAGEYQLKGLPQGIRLHAVTA